MKKLNRKGFTLVELLAVIIILAIVVGITIPAILTTTSSAREKAFQTSADSFADWLNRQYQAYIVGDTDIVSVDSVFTTKCSSVLATGSGTCTVDAGLLSAGGLKSTNYAESGNTATFTNGKACVSLTASEGGDYKSGTKTSGC